MGRDLLLASALCAALAASGCKRPGGDGPHPAASSGTDAMGMGAQAPFLPAIGAAMRVPSREPLALTEAERGNGYWECVLPDPGMGAYAPMRSMPLGWAVIPKSGGHTEEMGFDVLVHFHGFQSARKAVVTSARGVVLAGFDLGNSSGAYAEKVSPLVFQKIRDNVTAALKAHTKDDRAHIRHLALTAWSAGYAAVNRILRGGDTGIDAVVLLDGLHTGYVSRNHDDPAALDVAAIEPILAYAKRAADGEKIFFFTHSQVGADTYASTTKTASLLLSRLGLVATPGPPTTDPYGLVDFVEKKGLFVRGYGGANEKAHCDQVRFMRDAVREVLEPAWQTPPAKTD